MSTSNRSAQSVNTIEERRRVLRWMRGEIKRANVKKLISRAVFEFPDIFRGGYKANLEKASRWWRQREGLSLAGGKRGASSISCAREDGRKKLRRKTLGGRGRNRADWVKWLYPKLLREFERMRKLGIKLSYGLIIQIAQLIIVKSSNEVFNQQLIVDGASVLQKITFSWVVKFCEAQNIAVGSQARRKQLSERKERFIRSLVAVHLGQLKRGFLSGELQEDLQYNMDETHFAVDQDNGKTLGLRGEKYVKYCDVVSGGEGMTLVVLIRGGRNASVLNPMIIFTNSSSSYPIRGVPDCVSGVTYRSAPNGFINRELMKQRLNEPRTWGPTLVPTTRHLWLDN